MNNIVITYSLIKSIYEKSKDYLDIFVPFLLNSFPGDQQECTKEFLTRNLEQKFGLKVPEHTLKTIITRAARRNYVVQNQKKCFLTENGSNFRNNLLAEQNELKRQVNALIEDIRIFINDKYFVSLNFNEISDIINSFTGKYQIPLINLFNPQTIGEVIPQLDFTKEEVYLLEYIKLAQKQKPDMYDVLKKIFYGAIISTVLYRENIADINEKFSKLQIFLDTNFMFSVLDLHYPYICAPAKELFNLLKKYKFQLKVFDFTINEMSRVLKGYLKEGNKYFPNVKVDSIYSNLRNKGWTSEDCIHFISNIEKKIYDLGIQIEYTNIDLDSFKINDQRYERISQYKPDQNPLGQRHDICAIEKIREIRRKRPQRKIENCIALFLTSDLKLTNFDFIEMGHREYSSVSEVISDRLLTTLLWLKNPEFKKPFPLEKTLWIQNELLISREIWNRFFENIDKLRKEGNISEEDISALIYYHQLESDLVTIKPSEVTSNFVLKEIEESKRKMEENIAQKTREEIERVREEFTREMEQKDKERLAEIDNIKSILKRKAEKRAKIYLKFFYILPISLVIIGIILIKIKILTATIITFLFSSLTFFGIKFDVFKFKNKIFKKCFNKTYMKLLNEFQLEETLK